jgi:hypothetical protein
MLFLIIIFFYYSNKLLIVYESLADKVLAKTVKILFIFKFINLKHYFTSNKI